MDTTGVEPNFFQKQLHTSICGCTKSVEEGFMKVVEEHVINARVDDTEKIEYLKKLLDAAKKRKSNS